MSSIIQSPLFKIVFLSVLMVLGPGPVYCSGKDTLTSKGVTNGEDVITLFKHLATEGRLGNKTQLSSHERTTVLRELSGQDNLIIMHACRAAASYGANDLELCRAVFSLATSEDSEKCAAAVAVLGAMAVTGVDVTEVLEKVLFRRADTKEEMNIRCNAISAYAQVKDKDKVIASLILGLKDRSPLVRAQTIRTVALCQLVNIDSIRHMLTELAKSDPEKGVRLLAKNVLDKDNGHLR